MPTFLYQCGSCQLEVEVERPIGTADRLVRCPDCGGTALQVLGRGLRIGAGALPNKRAGVINTLAGDEKLAADRDAYWRMRHHGLQPPTVTDAARLEDTVADNFDITYKDRLTRVKKQHGIKEPWESTRRRAQEAMLAAEDAGWSPVK